LPLIITIFTSTAYAQILASEGYKGIILKSDNRKTGKQFTFVNLSAQRPFVTYPSGNRAETVKVFKNSELIVLIFVTSATGSTETFYVNKKMDRFTLIEVGALEATVMKSDFRPKISYGKLE
jgi:hypothetical protein